MINFLSSKNAISLPNNNKKRWDINQRYAIKAYLQCGKTQKFIAKELGVSESAISKELTRNRLKQGGYNPKKAQKFTQIRKERFTSNR